MTIDKGFVAPRAALMEEADNVPVNTSANREFNTVLDQRMGRRDALKGLFATAAVAGLGGTLLNTVSSSSALAGMKDGRFHFEEISHGVDEKHHVAKGYDADILLRWGDPIFPDSPKFDPYNQTRESQEKQFGYNNDFLGLVYLDDKGDRALLCVNHEYTNEELMFPGLGRQDRADFVKATKDIVDVEMAAHGNTVIEIMKVGGKWKPVLDSKYNRRITANTEMVISGPAAGADLMKTNADPSGTKVFGTINNCAGGITPWGTYLTAEENFNGYFWNKDAAAGHANADMLKRYGAPGQWYNWGAHYDRFDIGKEPNEVHRFGWIVEIDPMDPNAKPVKRTALGRFKHEGAESIINRDGRVVVYSGDDQRGDYLYKFVSKGKYNPNDRQANMRLLDEGTLYVARFDADGTVIWLPLEYGKNGLDASNGFTGQADVVVFARKAGDILGATKMDRPEDVEPNKTTNKVYVMLTNNKHRGVKYPTDAANPREKNPFGHIIEITPDQGDNHAAAISTWDMLVKCGNPDDPAIGTMWNPATTENGWFAAPDNAVADHQGRLWITTDQGSGWSKSGTADGVWAMETEGDLRGTGKMFFRVPLGAEMCGPCFDKQDETLFVAVQHPASDGVKAFPGFERNSVFEDPATRWPDFDPKTPPRPSVVMITKQGGGVIGS